MNLFERIKNIRKNNLQEKRKFPGDESGAYKQAKDDLEARKGFKKNKSGGLKADERNPYVKRSVRKSRVDKLGGDIYDQPKFSQKEFDKSLKKKYPKTPKTSSQPSLVGAGGSPGTKPPSSKPTSSFKKPSDPFAGSYDTPGRIKVKAMDTKAFKKTQPSDIKLPKSFTDFQRNLQDYKDRNVPGGPRKTGRTSFSGSPSGSRFDPEIGMAPSDKPKVVKQSEVSKKAKDYTKQINQNRTSSGTPMRRGATNVPKDAAKDIQVKKMRDRVNQLVGEREKMRSAPGKKDVKGMRNVNKQIKQLTKSMNTKPFVPTVYNKKNIGATSGAKKIPDTFKTYPTAGGNKVTPTTRSLTNKNKGSIKFDPPKAKVSSPPLSPKGKKFVSKIPGFLKKNKTLAKIGRAALKSPTVAAVAGVGLAAAGVYAGYKALTNRKKEKKLSYKDFKSLSTPSNPDKGKVIDRETGKPARFSSTRKIPKSSSAEFKSKYYYK